MASKSTTPTIIISSLFFVFLINSILICSQVNAQKAHPKDVETTINKNFLNIEFKRKFGNLKEGCFPRPKGVGCRCTEKDENGYDREKIFETEAECREENTSGSRKRRRVAEQKTKEADIPTATREKTKTANNNNNRVDPVEERARQNYAAVIKELKNKFAGLREGCYPRPKGCLCVVGKDATGREITSRRMKDSECKCAPGERSKECPAQGA
uniref:Uncharacterized protein n=1 Tax=Meloidogyne enterolobii TaxID=390850 RepID=A0A6V7UYV1_MELEN|nr:unnamed protein product [Meloidogyne enterolobii]